jgi:hypothetical protein
MPSLVHPPPSLHFLPPYLLSSVPRSNANQHITHTVSLSAIATATFAPCNPAAVRAPLGLSICTSLYCVLSLRPYFLRFLPFFSPTFTTQVIVFPALHSDFPSCFPFYTPLRILWALKSISRRQDQWNSSCLIPAGNTRCEQHGRMRESNAENEKIKRK